VAEPFLLLQMAMRGVKLPDTLIINKKVVTEWLYSDPKKEDLMVSRKRGPGGWRAEEVLKALSSPKDGPNKVVAQYWYRQSNSTLDERTGKKSKAITMEYLTRETLEELLVKREATGILQRYVAPKGEKNEVIRVVWTPGVVLMERRQNRHNHTDRLVNLYDRFATYDGKPHNCRSHEVRAQPTIDTLNDMCEVIRRHVQLVTRQEIIRMVAFFKVDSSDRVWFLYMSSIRLETKGNLVPKPLDLEGPTPVPKEIATLPPIDKRKRLAKKQRGWDRCPCCAELILQVDPQLITVRQGVEVFQMMTQSREYRETGQMPRDEFGYRMSADLYDMRRAIALQTGDAFKEPAKPTRSAKGLFHKIKKKLVQDEDDLGNALLVPPVVRNSYPKLTPQQCKDKLGDPLFQQEELKICLNCYLRHQDVDLPQQLELLRYPNEKTPANTQPNSPVGRTGGRQGRPDALAALMRSLGGKEESLSPASFNRSLSCPLPAISEEMHATSLSGLRKRAKRHKRQQKSYVKQNGPGVQQERDGEGKLVLPSIIPMRTARAKIPMEWDGFGM